MCKPFEFPLLFHHFRHSLLSELPRWVFSWLHTSKWRQLMSKFWKMHSFIVDVRQVFCFWQFLEKFLFRNVLQTGSEQRAASTLMPPLWVQSYQRALPCEELKPRFVLLSGQRDSRQHHSYFLFLKGNLSFFFFSYAGQMESAVETVCVKYQAKYSSGKHQQVCSKTSFLIIQPLSSASVTAEGSCLVVVFLKEPVDRVRGKVRSGPIIVWVCRLLLCKRSKWDNS